MNTVQRRWRTRRYNKWLEEASRLPRQSEPDKQDALVLTHVKNQALEKRVQAVTSLAGVRTSSLNSGQEPNLTAGRSGGAVLVTDDPHLPGNHLAGLPRITVAAATADTHADVFLPGEEEHLLIAILQWCEPAHPTETTYLVGSWGTCLNSGWVAWNFASTMEAVLLDASGVRSTWVPPRQTPTWDTLAFEDLWAAHQLRSSLPKLRGVPVLTAGKKSPLRPDCPQVAQVGAALGGEVVVDCGAGLDGLADLGGNLLGRGRTVRTVLVGSPNPAEAAHLARNLGALSGRHVIDEAMLITLGKPSSSVWAAVTSSGQQVLRGPSGKSSRRWAAVAAKVKAR